MKLTTILRAGLSKHAIQTEKEWSFKTPWGQLSALSWGDPSNAPVLLCQGRMDTSSSFRPLVRHLPPQQFYVAVELPGNGRSDHYPRDHRLTITDFVPPLERVVDYFKWNKISFIGHSLGAAIGKYFITIFPDLVSRIVDLDPEPAYLPVMGDPREWYRQNYKPFYGEDGYFVKGPEFAPKYTYEDARCRLMKARGISEEAADDVLERCLEPMGDGLHRFTFDQRFRQCIFPLHFDNLQNFYTAPNIPTLGIFSTESISRGCYDTYKFCMDDSAWKHGNYRHLVAEGGHDIHLQKPKEIARYIEKFFNENPEK